jgi:two-component system, LytTR family, sensor kinase
MKGFENRYFKRSFGKRNFLYGLVGLATGLLISAFESTVNSKLIPQRDFISNLIFCTLITLSITNSVYFFARFWRSQKKPMWYFILVFYGFNVLGMLIGIELSFLVVALIFHTPFQFFSHFNNYRFSFLVLAIVATIIYFNRLQQASMSARLHEKELDLVRVKQLKTQAELQTLQSKINPHFLYNSLNSIAGLIHENADKAEDMTLKLSRLFRYSINSNQENMALLTDEMEIVNTYLDIEKVRFGDRLNFVIDVCESVKNEHIPRFLIQPLVENALKHGLNDMASNGKLKISVTRDGENLMIAIADNGKPFPADLNIGYGLQSTYDKLALLYEENYQLQIINTPEKQVRILIPTKT